MITTHTKKPIRYTYREMSRDMKHVKQQKNQLNVKERGNGGNDGQKNL